MAKKKSKPAKGKAGSESTQEVMTINQAAEFLQISRAALYRLIADGEIKGKRVGQRWRFSKKALLKWIENGNGKDK